LSNTRTESDSFGSVEVPADALWGAQTARSLHFFAIGEQRMPLVVIHALAWIKWAAAGVNRDLQLLDVTKAQAISDAAERVAAGGFDAEFPLSVWQTGSGTQSNMNVNEVVAHLASRALAAEVSISGEGISGEGVKQRVHPNDDVNLGQSSNDVFPTAMHIAVALQAKQSLQAGLESLAYCIEGQSLGF
jgi:fumarate hydratase, class II